MPIEIVLLGAGHTHVEVLRRFASRPPRGVRLTVVSRDPAMLYSGMLPGVMRGDYTLSSAAIPLGPLAAAAGARLVLGEATALDLAARRVRMTGLPDLAFDLLSLNIGGTPAMPDCGGLPVKPIGAFLDAWRRLEPTLPVGAPVVVVGAGAAGVELVLALARRHASRLRLTLIAAGPEPLAEAPSRARRRVRTALAEARVAIRTGVTALRHHDGQLLLSDGSALDAAACLWATGAQGPRFLADAGLDCDRTGCVLVDATLRSVSHDGVFAAGDCAALTASPRPKAGVWAVRAGPPLAENLRRAAASRPPRPWHPQRQALVLLGLGDGRAVGWRNGITVFGPAVWWWKDWLDRRWVRRYARFHEPR